MPVRLGKTQKKILEWIGEDGAAIYVGVIPPPYLRGYDYEELENSLKRLLERKIIYRRGNRYFKQEN